MHNAHITIYEYYKMFLSEAVVVFDYRLKNSKRNEPKVDERTSSNIRKWIQSNSINLLRQVRNENMRSYTFTMSTVTATK